MAELEVLRHAHRGRAKVRLRVAMEQASGAAAVLALPTTPLSWTGENPSILWLGPDQWLILSDTQTAEAIITECATRLQGLLHSATDASAALMCFAVEGRSARLLLGMGSGVDFDARSFDTGRCVCTRFARIPALVRAVAAERFELYVDRSLGGYLASWFEHACRDPIFTIRKK
jgi:heterotetrameric sarcosine oxidase gamma subunit